MQNEVRPTKCNINPILIKIWCFVCRSSSHANEELVLKSRRTDPNGPHKLAGLRWVGMIEWFVARNIDQKAYDVAGGLEFQTDGTL